MTLAVLTTIYPEAVPYLADFVASMAAQTDSAFTLYVANDGLTDAHRHFTSLGARVRLIPVHGTITQVRQQTLRRIAADGHDQVVFADSDDRFSPGRVAAMREELRDHEVVCNELVPFGLGITNGEALLRPLIRPGATISWRDVLDHNLLGLSNTAAQVAVALRHSDHVASDIQAFDWALFVRALLHGARAVFTDQAVTFYRQHDHQLGVLTQRDPDSLRRAVLVKARHYEDIATLAPEMAERAHFFAHLRDDAPAFAHYVTTMAAQPSAPGLWWSAARFLKESDHAAL
jgi:glycosyltransferase involved in cell wall biosynthesis